MSDSVAMVAALGGELITYLPYGGTAKTFTALVEREPSRVSAFSGAAYPEHALLVTFPRDATDGVVSIAKGKDRVRFRHRLSDSDDKEFTVVTVQDEDAGLVSSDGGMFTVVVK